jgi:hypothetical protein
MRQPNDRNPESYTQGETFAVCRKLVDALNTWPDIDTISCPRNVKRARPTLNLLLEAVQYGILPQKPVRGPQITLGSDKRRSTRHTRGALGRIDPAAGSYQKVACDIQPNQTRRTRRRPET